MRIKQISVTKLFGIFDHVIPMNMKDRITIIHGKNGVGKTVLLRIVNSFFNVKYSEIRNTPFQDFKIEFDDGSQISVSKSNDINDKKQIICYFKNAKGAIEKTSLDKTQSKREFLNFFISNIDEKIPEIERIKPNTWLYLPTGEELYLEDIIERFGKFLPRETNEIRFQEVPNWLKNLRESIHVRFIEAQRLFNISNGSSIRSYAIRSSPSMLPSVATYSEELAENIQAKLAEYGKLSQSLDRTFPARVVQQQSLTNLTDEELRRKLNELEEKRSQLIEAGLLNRDEDPNFQVKEEIDNSTKKLLSVYVEDVEKKLNVFRDIAQKTDLLKRIVNERFAYKNITINQDKGFKFTTHDGHLLSPTELSSGEQHELVILYELLFKAEPNSLILIDEPELSLHVEWQVQFLRDLQEITKLANLDILIATHSPDIIHDRWDLTVKLQGPTK